VEEATAAARSMEEQAVQLTQAVSVFKISDDSTRTPRSTTPVAAKFSVIAGRTVAAAKSPVRPAAAPKRAVAAGASHDASDWQEF
ncbi:methyl-accepting chemotaxis protein, partial [Xanthomonas hortorum pv. vitians]|nr:methyl-accepting chemotaxis protein [Xanthomonas hortorum pv. vitians]